MQIKIILVNCLIYILIFTLLACSSGSYRETDLRTRLNNRGPVALSSDNPYLAANQFVVEQSEQSEVINGFIDYRGAPNAIEIVSSYFQKPVIYYYYTDKREFYTIEQLSHTWVVSGPERVGEDKFAKISELTASFIGRPALTKQIDNEIASVNNKNNSNLKASSSVTPKISTPSKPSIPNVQPNNYSNSATLNTNSNDFLKKDSLDMKERQLIEDIKNYQSQYGQTNAEITPKGDLVHYVTFPGESLSLIARWYTHDRTNAERLARINRLTEPNKLELGDIIVVPSYLLKSKVIFTKTILDSLVQKSK